MSPTETRLASRYRALLFAYPRDFQTDRGHEVVSTLLDLASPSQTWPRTADAIDLIGNGLRARTARIAAHGLAEGAQLAAPVAVSLSAGLAVFLSVRVEPEARTVGLVAYLLWSAAALAWALPRLRLARVLIGVAAVTTGALPGIAAAVGAARPPLWVAMSLIGFGVIALAGTSPGVVGPGRLDDRLAVPLGAVGVSLVAGLLSRSPSYYQPTLALAGLVVAAVIAVTSSLALRRLARGRPSAAWWWATLLLALPGGWLGPIGGAVANPSTMPAHFGHLAEVSMATAVVGGAFVVLSPIGARAVSSLAVAVGLTLAAFACVSGGLRGWPLLTAVAVVVAGVLIGRPRLMAAPMALCAFGLAVAVGAYDNDWTLHEWAAPRSTALLVSTLAMVPFALVAVVALRSMSARHAFAVGIGSVWVGWTTLPYVSRWGPVLLVLALAGVAAACVYAPRRISATRASGEGGRPRTSAITSPDERSSPHL
jgi:hypothetical protein